MSKNRDGQPGAGTVGPAAELAHRVLEHLRAARPRRRRWPRRRARSCRPAATATSSTMPGSRCGHVVQVAGEDPRPRPRRGAPGCGRRRASTPPTPAPSWRRRPRRGGQRQRLGHVGGGLGQHRLHGPEQRQADGVEAVLALGQGDRGDAGQVAGQHGGPPHRGQRHPGRLGQRVGDQALQRAVAQLADEQPAEQVLLGLGGPAEQRPELGGSGPPGSRRHAGESSRSSVASMSATSSWGSADGGTSMAATVRQPMPIRPCVGLPVRMAATTGTSAGSRRANRSASAATLRERARVAVTSDVVATTSANRTPPSWRTPSPPDAPAERLCPRDAA